MDDIRLPMQQGSMDDISQSTGGDGGSQNDSDLPDSMSSQGARAIYEREARITIDYAALDDSYKDVSG